ncbi:ankyrin repeat domain-containing protein [Agarivorans sp. MS3-6]
MDGLATVVRKFLVVVSLALFCHNALALTPELISDKSARWEFNQNTNDQGITSLWTQTLIDGSIMAVYYDERAAKLKFDYKEWQEWVVHIGEITVDGRMLAAYSHCYIEGSPACKTSGNSFELFMDSESLEQLKKGTELRTTLKFKDGQLRTFVVALNGTRSALDKLQSAWKKAGTTDLMFALLRRDHRKVKALLNSKQDVNVMDRAGRSALSIVLPGRYYDDEISADDKKLIRLLVKHGAEINVIGRSATLHEHIKGNASLEFIAFLLELGADPNFKSAEGDRPILAIDNHDNFKALYKLLVANGANKFATGADGSNLLHAVSVGLSWSDDNSDKIEFLVEQGFKVNAKDDSGMTPLIYAVMGGNIEHAKLLVKKGANTNPTLNNGSKVQDEFADTISRAEAKGNWEHAQKYKNALEYLQSAEVVRIAFKNKTGSMVQVAIRYKNSDDEWVTKEWYNIEAGETNTIARTNNRVFYYFAMTDDGEWRGTDNYYYVQGFDEKKGFREKTAPKKYRGDTYTVFLND